MVNLIFVIIKNENIKVSSAEEICYSRNKKEYKTLLINDNYKLTSRDKVVYICNKCNKETTEKFSKKHLEKNLICASCARQATNLNKYGGKYPIATKAIRYKIAKTNLKKYGVENPFQAKEVKDKIKKTNLKKYGVPYSTQNPEVQRKSTQTNLKKYGTKYSCQAEKIKRKIRATNLKKYGAESVLSVAKIRHKIEATNLKKYGAKYALQAEKVKQKAKETIKQKYGVEYISQAPAIQEKIKQTNLKKYGVENPAASQKIQEKIKQTNLKKYGVDNPSKSEAVKAKRSLTMLRRFGNTNPFKVQSIIDKITTTKKNKFLDEIFSGNRVVEATPLFTPKEYTGVTTMLSWRCDKCNTVFNDNLDYGSAPRCPVCYPILSNTSSIEKEVRDYLSSLNIIHITNDRNLIHPKELDIFVPQYRIAIEIDGLYWHSDQFKPKNYHLQKTQLCEAKGIQLIHIFEDEWIYKQSIVKSRLKYLFGLCDQTIGARLTNIQSIETATKNIFLDTYHMQGADRSSIKIGAFYKDRLMGIMTFVKPRLSLGQKKSFANRYELSRYASIANISLPGLASKMLKYFIVNYKPLEIYTYADRRWSQGKIYKQLGFQFVGFTQPNYWYSLGQERKHRFKYRKSALKNFKNYHPSKTEFQIMDEAGYYRIYDCGNSKFDMQLKKPRV